MDAEGHDLNMNNLVGAQKLVDWFGRFPSFHDAAIIDMKFEVGKAGSMSIHAWNLIDETDETGQFLTDKHAVVHVKIDRVHALELNDFELDAIIFELSFVGTEEQTEIVWSSSYGVDGRVVGTGVELSLQVGKPK